MDEIQLGQHIYSDGQLRQIMNQPVDNNGLVALAQELIATKLNIACNHSDDSCIAQTVIDADMVIGNLIVPPVGNGFLPLNSVNNLLMLLGAYNKGNMCAPYCEATPTPTPCQLDKPAVQCSTSASSNIAIEVIAGESGAPNGFVIEWMTMANFAANGNQWPDDPTAICQASFSNNLAPNQTTEVVIGDDRLFDSVGVQSDCSGDPLLCDTAYVFRCRTNATQSCDASEWGNTIACATLPCDPGHNCTYTQGYWKNHSNAWPLQGLMLGAVNYNASQLLQILNRPAQGNGLVILAHQLIAAKLNIANGADPTAAQPTVNAADNMIGGLVIPPIGNGNLSPGQTSSLTTTLTEYNEGTIGPGHCDD
jgi:hypothetical protein